MDNMVLKTQQWLNSTYENRTGYSKITPDGITGWSTIYALTKALQIEFGITATANAFGPTTIKKFNERFPNGISQQENGATEQSNIYSIIQGALLCKGYPTGAYEITGNFYGGTGSGIKNLKDDMGFSNPNSTVTLNVMKALLSMDQFKLILSVGNSKIREIQQKLNNKYESYIGICPCDGVYGREMNKSLIIALQKIEKFTPVEATGTFGNGTKERLTEIPSNGKLSEDDEKDSIELIRYALVCNGYDNVNINSNKWDNTLSNVIKEFQSKMLLDKVAICDKNTWMALLISSGNIDRPFNAIDTGFTIYHSAEDAKFDGYEVRNRIQTLKNAGINIVGRYITGEQGKQLKFDEAKALIDNGLKFYPIFQRDGTPTASHFNAQQGIADADFAYDRAKYYCLPKNTIIYFSIDFDALDNNITNNILPYFKSLKERMNSEYKIGVYGTRNVCNKVLEKKYAVTSFVSTASTGYSGNLGFNMPDNWNIDQFRVEESMGDFKIDRNIYSGKYPVVETLAPRTQYTGEITFTGTNFGRALLYSKRRLKLYVTATGENGENLEDVSVVVTMKNIEPLYDPFDTVYAVVAAVNGKRYGFEDTAIFDYDGNKLNITGMTISDDVHYQMQCLVKGKNENGELVILDNQKVKVKLEVYTEDM